MDIQTRISFDRFGDARWRVVQVFAAGPATSGHEVTLRQNFQSQRSAQIYADRVVRVGFEYA